MTRDQANEIFRQQVLKGYDRAADLAFGQQVLGAKDEDLPRLFYGIDLQFYALVNRYDIEFPGDVEHELAVARENHNAKLA